jgi:ribosomal protein L2
MSLHKAKPTSAGRRFVVAVKTPGLHKGKPHAPLLEKKSGKGGRNNNGRITVRHQGGGHKQHYRLVDFKRDKDGRTASVATFWRQKVSVQARRSSVAKTHRSSRVTRCRFVRFQLVRQFITLR